MTKELKRFEQWWDAEDDIPNNGPYTPDTPIQFAWAGWQAALTEQPAPQKPIIKSYLKKDNSQPVKWSDYEPDGMHHNKPQKRPQNCGTGYCSCIECVMEPAQQEPVAWMTEERYAEMHTSKWTPKIQQVFSKDGILESQTIQYAPQSKTVPYPLAQRTWLGLTDEEAVQTWEGVIKYAPGDVRIKDFARAIEAKLKEKNT